MRIHSLEASPGRPSGIELVGKTRTSTTRLYASQTARLAEALREAVASKRGTAR